MDISSTLQKITADLAKRPEILHAYLYGSYARGNATPTSDVDICVVLDNKKLPPDLYDYMFQLQGRLTKLAGGTSVEAIPRQLMSYPLYYTSVLFGKSVYTADTKNKVDFENRAFDDYTDIKPLYDMRYNKIVERLHSKDAR